MSTCKKLFLFLTLLLPLNYSLLSVNNNESVLAVAYIEKYKDYAIEEMVKYGIPASITLAQGLFETNFGVSKLAITANNHFGIKCHKSWNGPYIVHSDDRPNECFRKYETVKDSYRDHSMFLTTRPWYGFLFKIDVINYKAWAYGLKKAGYATNPYYSYKLIRIIEDYKLNEIDKAVVIVTSENNYN